MLNAAQFIVEFGSEKLVICMSISCKCVSSFLICITADRFWLCNLVNQWLFVIRWFMYFLCISIVLLLHSIDAEVSFISLDCFLPNLLTKITHCRFIYKLFAWFGFQFTWSLELDLLGVGCRNICMLKLTDLLRVAVKRKNHYVYSWNRIETLLIYWELD